MNMKLVKLLSIVVGVLLVIILCEWFYALYAQKSLLASLHEGAKKKTMTVELPTVDLANRPETDYEQMVTRPLFIQGRRPAPETKVDDKKPVAAANVPFDWALNGVYTQNNQLYALLSRTVAKTPKERFKKLTKNNEIDGWKLTQIEREKVVFSQGDQKKELPLRKPKPKTPPNGQPTPNPAIGLPPVPGQPPQPPEMQPGQPPVPIPSEGIPGQEQVPEVVPEPVPEVMDPAMEPEFIPDENSEIYFENNQNEQYQ